MYKSVDIHAIRQCLGCIFAYYISTCGWLYAINKGTPPMDDFSVSVPGGIDMLGYSVFSCKFLLLSVLGMSRQNFCPRVGK